MNEETQKQGLTFQVINKKPGNFLTSSTPHWLADV